MRVLLLLALAACAVPPRTPAPTTPHNVVVLLADDLGIGEVGAYGQRELLTPNMDQLARDGMRFTEFRSSAAVCGPARCSFMTGYHNGRCRLDDNDNDYLRSGDITLAERFKGAGYATALVGKWGLSWESEPESWPQAQGFDTFFGYRDQVHAHNFFPEVILRGTDSVRLRNVVPAPRGMGSGNATTRLDYVPDLMRAEAHAFITANAARPFFLFYATNLPHIHNETRTVAPDGGFEVTDLGPYADKDWSLPKKSYAAQVYRLDQELGALRALLDSLQIDDRTIVIFLSDNGATFLRDPSPGSTAIIGDWFNGTAGYRGYKGDLYDGGLRVPAIVHWPGVTRGGSTSAVRLDFTDLHATLAQIAGAPAPSTIDGRSFVPVLTGRGSFALRPYQVWYSPDRRQSAVLEGRWKAVWMRDTMRVFDIERDPGELTDLRASEPGVAARLDSIRVREDLRVVHPVRRR